MNNHFDVVVVGEGIAGLTAAGLLAARGLRVASFEGNMFGGVVLNLIHLDPAPTDAPSSGSEYATNLLSANMDSGVTRFEEPVKSLTSSQSGYLASTETISIEAPCVVVASGARWKLLRISGEAEFDGRGISRCADCDGRLFSGRDVVVVGGGDSALQEALVLSGFCRKVHLVVRDKTLRAQQRFVVALTKKVNVEITLETELVSIEGERDLAAVIVRNVQTRETYSISCAGLFPFIGLVANTDYLPSTLHLDDEGRVVTNDKRATNLPSIWAIGAVRADGDGLLSGAVNDARIVADAIADDLEKRIAMGKA